MTTPEVNETAAAAAESTAAVVVTTEKEPGFEAVFAIAGLLAVAFLVLRQRKLIKSNEGRNPFTFSFLKHV